MMFWRDDIEHGGQKDNWKKRRKEDEIKQRISKPCDSDTKMGHK
jgi:hypothetical protein